MNKEEIIAIGKKVLDKEAESVRQMADSLGDDFYNAVNTLANAKGRVIVTGMGKSGHIGRKIAATMTSTGTPAFFVHPAEASHGDLGMLTKNDVILALSNSGETKELADVIAYSRHFAIPLICIVGKQNSTLAKASDYVLCHSPEEDACPLGLAPTTSTTATLAMGDALAMVLLEMKGFSKEQFKTYHPGGKLGAMLLKAKELMIKGSDMPLVPEQTPMPDTLLEMTRKSLGCVGVVNNTGDLIGIITDGDLRRNISRDLPIKKAGDIMTKNPKTIDGNMLVAQAVQMMNEKKITTLFVMDGTKPVGVLHMHQCLAAGVV